MKTCLTLWSLIFGLLPVLITAQEYAPLVREGSIWITWHEQEYRNTYHAFEISTDTIIQDTDYKKVIYHELRDGATNPFLIERSFLAGAIREDLTSKSIYGRLFFDYYLLSQECRELIDQEEDFLMLDFQYELGDTIMGCSFPFPVEEKIVDTILYAEYFGQSRKTFASVTDNVIYPILIEGIGNLDGLFAAWNPVISPGDGNTELVNYCLSGALSCGLISNVDDDLNDKIDLNLFPNPVSEYLHLTIQEDHLQRICIFDQQGQMIKSNNYKSQQYYIGDLAPGIYLVKIETDNGSFTEKIVKL